MLELFKICPHTNTEKTITEGKPVGNSRLFEFNSTLVTCVLTFESENRKGYWFAMSLPNGAWHQMFFPKSEWNKRV